MNIDDWINIGIQNGIIDSNNAVDDISMSFCDVYKSWFNNKIGKVRPQTLDRIETVYRRYYLNSFLDNMNVFKINNDTLIRFFKQFCVTKKEYTRIRQIILGVFEFLIINDYKVNVLNWKKIENFIVFDRSNKKIKMSVPVADIDRMYDCVVNQKIYFEKQSGCLCLLLNFSLGLRIGELAVLTWDCVDWSNRLLYINKSAVKYYERDSNGRRISTVKYFVSTTKTDSGVRIIPLTDRAIWILRLLMEHHIKMNYKSDFLAYDGKDVIFVRSLDRTLRKLCKLCQIEYFESHRIRKTFATALHEAGVSTKKISVLLGHSDMIVTQKNYILNTSSDLVQLRSDMGKAI